MKVTDWCKNLRFALLAAAGIWIPSAASAQDIPVGDPGFDAYTVPASLGYAYAATPNGATGRPVPGSTIWTAQRDTRKMMASAVGSTTPPMPRVPLSARPAPRTGNQAMHGLFNYNAQETSAVFEANKAYTFSIWAAK